MFYQDMKSSKEIDFKIGIHELGMSDTNKVNELSTILCQSLNTNECNITFIEDGFSIVTDKPEQEFIECLKSSYINFIRNNEDIIKSSISLYQLSNEIVNGRFDLYSILDYTYMPYEDKNLYIIKL